MRSRTKLSLIYIFSLMIIAAIGFSVGMGNIANADSYNDPFYANNNRYVYSHISIDDEVWNVTRGKTNEHTSRVVVIDSGVQYNNREFLDSNGNTLISPLSYNVDSGKIAGIDGYDEIRDSDRDYHGTRVASIIFARGDNEYGIVGLAQDVELIVIKMTLSSRGSYTTEQFSNALNYVLSLDGVDVVNMSLGYFDGENPFSEQLRQIRERGAVIVASAGNEKRSDPNFPAADQYAVGVGAFENLSRSDVGSDYGLADYSAYGDINVDICAPGEMYTLDPTSLRGASKAEGTSFSAPIVTSAIALYKSLYPDATPQQAEEALFASADDKGEYGRDYRYGYGCVNFYNMICGNYGYAEFVHADGSTDDKLVCEVNGEALPLKEYPFLSEYKTFFGGWYKDRNYDEPVDYYREKIGINQKIYERTTDIFTDSAIDYTFDSSDNLVIKGYYGSGKEIYLKESLELGGTDYKIYKIAPRAFSDLDGVKIVFNYVETIDEYAFLNCNFSYLYLPETLKSVSKCAVYLCTGNVIAEKEITAFSNGWDNNSDLSVFENAGEYFVYDGLEMVGDEESGYTVLSGKEDIKLLKSDKKIVKIIDGAFKNSKNLESVELPFAEYIGAEAFMGCENLAAFKFGSLETIGKRAFAGCKALYSLDLRGEENLTSIGDYAFEGCTELYVVAIGEGVEKIGLGAFASDNPRILYLPFLGNRRNAVSYSFLGYIFGASRYATQKNFLPTELRELFVLSPIADRALYGMQDGVNVYCNEDYSEYPIISEYEIAEIYYGGVLCGLKGFKKGETPSTEDLIEASYNLENLIITRIEQDGNIFIITGEMKSEDDTPGLDSEEISEKKGCNSNILSPLCAFSLTTVAVFIFLKRKRD